MKSPPNHLPASDDKSPANLTKLLRVPTVFAFVAVILVGVLQIARNAAVASPVSASQYRLGMQVILDRDDVKVIKYRIESISPFYITVTHGQGHTSAASTLDPKARMHFTEITVLLDHIGSRKSVKELLTVGAAGGPSVESVTDDYVLNENTRIKSAEGTYRHDESVELLTWNGRTYSLSLEQ